MSEQEKLPRQELLEEAIYVTTQDRNITHGSPVANFTVAADLFTAGLHGLLKDGVKVEPWRVAILVDLLKTARLVTGSHQHRDNWVDKAGYSGCAWECIVEELAEKERVADVAKQVNAWAENTVARASVTTSVKKRSKSR